MEQFEGRVAVVTGAASGIGYATAERFAKEGMRVVLADIEEAALGLVVGVEDDDTVKRLLFKNPQTVYRVAERLRTEGMAMFAWDVAGSMAVDFADTFEVVEAEKVKAVISVHMASVGHESLYKCRSRRPNTMGSFIFGFNRSFSSFSIFFFRCISGKKIYCESIIIHGVPIFV